MNNKQKSKKSLWKINIKNICILYILLMFTCSFAIAQTTDNVNCNFCIYWESEVNMKIKLPKDYPRLDRNDGKTVLQAIDCLLKLEGKDFDSGFGTGGTSIENSKPYPSPTVEVAALYEITILYLGDFPYRAIQLDDKEGNREGKELVTIAYQAYRKWFEKVKKIGLEEARKQKLDPLENSGVEWHF